MNNRGMAVGLVLAAALVLGAGAARAARPARAPVQSGRVAQPSRIKTLDFGRRIDINNVNMFVTNYGAFAYDIGGNYNGGLFWPNHTSKTAVYAAGLWLGAQISGVTSLAVAEYSQEYLPGRIIAGTPEPSSNPDLVVYKVLPYKGVPADTTHIDNPYANFDVGEDPLVHHSWNEYMRGAVPYGAPWRIWRLDNTATPAPGDSVDVPGPDVIGDEMLWCVYNDAEPIPGQKTLHTNEAGGTQPSAFRSSRPPGRSTARGRSGTRCSRSTRSPMPGSTRSTACTSRNGWIPTSATSPTIWWGATRCRT